MSCRCTPQWRFLSSQARWSYCASGFWQDLASHQLELPVSDPKHENTIIFKANMLSRKANFYWNHKIQCWNTAYNHSAQSLTIFMATTTFQNTNKKKKKKRRDQKEFQYSSFHFNYWSLEICFMRNRHQDHTKQANSTRMLSICLP